MAHQTIPAYPKTIHQYLGKDIDIKAPVTTFVTNLGSALRALGPRTLEDDEHYPVYDILGALEDKARCAFANRCFDEIEITHAGKGLYAFFLFKGLRKLEDGTYIAYYLFDGTSPEI